MTSKQLLGIFSLLTISVLAMLPITTHGVVYAVITTCILLSLVPVSVETVMAHIEDGKRK